MKKHLAVLLFFAVIVSCKDKKVSLKGDATVDIEEFIDFFPEVPLPYRVADTTLSRKNNDSLLIGYNVFTQFVPDSVIRKEFGKTVKPRLFVIGRAREKGKETYLFVKAISGNKRVVFLTAFSKQRKYLDALPLIRTGEGYINFYGLLDNKFQITTYKERKKSSGDVGYKKDVYIFNSAANTFTLILTEPNEDIIKDVINPIDTLARKNKYSGDYVKDRKNFVSVRDGKNNTDLLFFVHFEKNKGECTGELKGNARLIKANIAQYQEVGNPCTVEFTFTNNGVTMHEVGGCGSYRGITCLFEGTYPKKKPLRPKESKKKK